MTTLLLLLVLLLMDQFTAEYTMFETVGINMSYDCMFASTLFASGKKQSAPRNETKVDTRVNPPQLANPATEPWMLPYPLYSAIMGLIINQGTLFLNNPRALWFPDQKRIRFSSVDESFLIFIRNYFSGYFHYGENDGITRMHGVKNVSLQTACTDLAAHLYNVWYNDQGEMILPAHFEQYFDWNTLAFWVMRNGAVTGRNLQITMRTLGMQDKLRVQAAILNNLGLTSKMQADGTYLAIHDFAKFSHNLKPLIHESQLHRLIPKQIKYPQNRQRKQP